VIADIILFGPQVRQLFQLDIRLRVCSRLQGFTSPIKGSEKLGKESPVFRDLSQRRNRKSFILIGLEEAPCVPNAFPRTEVF
jgi:hypothetical protein